MSGTSASRAARQFSVRRLDDGITLVDRSDENRSVELRRALIHLTIEGRALRVCRSLTPAGLERWLTLEIVQLSLGSEDDSSAISVWLDGEVDRCDAEDTIFGIDGQSLLDLEIAYARVIDLNAHDEDGQRYIGEDSGLDGDELTDDEEDGEGENHAVLAQLSYHPYAVVLDVGLLQPQFNDLIEASVSGRADTINLECRCHAYTTGWGFGSARDMVMSPGETVRLNVSEATTSVLVPTARSAPPSAATDDDDEAQIADRRLDLDHNAHASNGASGYAIVVATLVISIVLAFLGASSVVVLIIAVLGATTGVIGTLHSVAKTIVERLTSDLR
jgi:hypothetical protein